MEGASDPGTPVQVTRNGNTSQGGIVRLVVFNDGYFLAGGVEDR